MSDRKPYVFLCGVPATQCSGTKTNTNHALIGETKAHPSPEAAFNCHKNHLISQGYTMVGTRELQAPDGGPIRVLTKKCRFGARLRNGKEGTRSMPEKKSKRKHGGVVTSC